MGFAFYFKDLDCAVRGAGCETAAVVVEDCIVLLRWGVSLLVWKRREMLLFALEVNFGEEYDVYGGLTIMSS